MKKLLALALLASFAFSSCYNYKHGRSGWTKDTKKKTENIKPA